MPLPNGWSFDDKPETKLPKGWTVDAPDASSPPTRDPFSYSPQETAKFKQDFISKEAGPRTRLFGAPQGTKQEVMGIASPQSRMDVQKAKDWLQSPTPEAKSMTDFATRVVPSSLVKNAVGIPMAIAGTGKNIIEGAVNEGLSGAGKAAWEGAKGVGEFMGEKTGVLPPGAVSEDDAPVDYGTGLPKGIGQWAQRVGHQIITDPAGVGMAGEGVKGAVKAVPKAVDAVKDVGKGIGKVVDAVTPSPDVDKLITEKYEKGVRPTVVGKKTANQVESAANNVQRGVKKIVELKDNGAVQFGEEGSKEARTPQTLKEFADAISQGKDHVFQQYDGMMREANSQGATVDLSPISAELEKIAADPVLNDIRPGAASYAKTLSESLGQRGIYTAEQAQQAIKSLNTSLEAFYKNPTYDTAVKAYTDSVVANHLRSALDKSIEDATEPGYQELKKDYGALKSMEKEVNHRAIVDARKNVKGLLDFSDIFSGAEALKGILTMDPGSFVTGVAARGIKNWYKKLNDPNAQIKNMFERVDKHWDRGVEKPGFGAGVGTGIPEPPVDSPPRNPDAYDSSLRTPGETTLETERTTTPENPLGFGERELRPGVTGETPPLESISGDDATIRQNRAGFPKGESDGPGPLTPEIPVTQERVAIPGSQKYTPEAYLDRKGLKEGQPGYEEAKKLVDDYATHYGGHIDSGKLSELDGHVDATIQEATQPQRIYQATLDYLDQQTGVSRHKKGADFSSVSDFQSALKEGYPELRKLYESEKFGPGDVKSALRAAINGRKLGVQQERIIKAIDEDAKAHTDQGRSLDVPSLLSQGVKVGIPAAVIGKYLISNDDERKEMLKATPVLLGLFGGGSIKEALKRGPADPYEQMQQAFARGDMKTYNFWAGIADEQRKNPPRPSVLSNERGSVIIGGEKENAAINRLKDQRGMVGKDINAQPDRPGPFHSVMAEVIDQKMPNRMMPEQLKSMLKKAGVTDDEIANTLSEFEGKSSMVTKQEVQDAIKANGTELKDVVLGASKSTKEQVADRSKLYSALVDHEGLTGDEANQAIYSFETTGELGFVLSSPEARDARNKVLGYDEYKQPQFSTYQEPGAKEGSYREMFVTAAPTDTSKLQAEVTRLRTERDSDQAKPGELWKDVIARRHDYDAKIKEVLQKISGTQDWKDGHSQYADIQNPVVRIRFNEREADGKKILFVEEVQGPSDAEQAKMPEYLRKRIYDLGVKRVLAYAKENGFDGVSWTPGEMQAKRYDLSKHIKEIRYNPYTEHLVAATHDGRAAVNETVPKEKLADYVGKEIAASMLKEMEEKPNRNVLREGLDLKVGGEGLKRLYDSTLPALFKKYGKEGVGEIDHAPQNKLEWSPRQGYEYTESTGKYFIREGENGASANRPFSIHDARTGEQLWRPYKTLDEAKTRVEKENNISSLGKTPYLPITDKTAKSYPGYAEGGMVINEQPRERRKEKGKARRQKRDAMRGEA